jgi:flagellar biosynthesis protein
MDSKRNPVSQAVALRYDQPGDAAPRVLATGRGDVADQIIAAARAAGIEIVEDSDLLEVLGRMPVGAEIPEELFDAVAEILAFIYRLNGRYASLHDD